MLLYLSFVYFTSLSFYQSNSQLCYCIYHLYTFSLYYLINLTVSCATVSIICILSLSIILSIEQSAVLLYLSFVYFTSLSSYQSNSQLCYCIYHLYTSPLYHLINLTVSCATVSIICILSLSIILSI